MAKPYCAMIAHIENINGVPENIDAHYSRTIIILRGVLSYYDILVGRRLTKSYYYIRIAHHIRDIGTKINLINSP